MGGEDYVDFREIQNFFLKITQIVSKFPRIAEVDPCGQKSVRLFSPEFRGLPG